MKEVKLYDYHVSALLTLSMNFLEYTCWLLLLLTRFGGRERWPVEMDLR